MWKMEQNVLFLIYLGRKFSRQVCPGSFTQKNQLLFVKKISCNTTKKINSNGELQKS